MPHIVTDCYQGSPDWHQLRAGVPTASEFSRFITSTFEPSKSEGRQTYLCQKVAEIFTGVPASDFEGSFRTEQGILLEKEARGWFSFEHDKEVRQVAFVYADGNKAGCSPDGLIGDDEGIEIKAPGAANHVRYLLEGRLPREYALQVHASLWVTGRRRWWFLSYHRKLPPFLLTVERDEEIMQKIGAAVDAFDADLKAYQKIIEAKQQP